MISSDKQKKKVNEIFFLLFAEKIDLKKQKKFKKISCERKKNLNKNKLLFSLSSDKIYIRNECRHKKSNNNSNSNNVNAFLLVHRASKVTKNSEI
jgi:hypothetical protein